MDTLPPTEQRSETNPTQPVAGRIDAPMPHRSETRQGIAVHVALEAPAAHQVPGEDIDHILADLRERARELLAACGLSVYRETGKDLLGAAPLTHARHPAHQCEPVIRAALARHQRWSGIRLTRGLVRIRITVHADAVAVEQTPQGPVMTGGPLLAPERWSCARPVHGVLATSGVVDGTETSFRLCDASPLAPGQAGLYLVEAPPRRRAAA